MRTPPTWILTCLIAVGLATVAPRGEAAPTLQSDPAVTRAQEVRLFGQSALKRLEGLVAGRGIEGTAATQVFTPYGQIVWRVVRDEQDPPDRHVFYQQTLQPDQDWAYSLEARYQRAGIEVRGGLIAVHYIGEVAEFIIGAQFSQIQILGAPLITQARDAFERTQGALVTRPGFEAALWHGWPHEFVLQLQAHTELILVSDGDDNLFRFGWDVPTVDANGHPYHVLLDATTGEIVSVEDRLMDGVCGAQTGRPQVGAVGIPQNPNIALQGNRNLWATTTTERPGFTHEGHRLNGGAGVPELEVYYGTTSSAYWCDDGTLYGLLALNVVNGYPRFDNYIVNPPMLNNPNYPDYNLYPGKAAADAMWFTHVTMSRLNSSPFNWNSYDGAGSIARNTVNFPVEADNAAFRPIQDGGRNDVVVNPRKNQMYSYSSCLDVIAHEWGHGIANSRGLPYSGVQAQLHEGFADVIGHMIERYSQPSGGGPEHADWIMGEDNPAANQNGWPYFRRVDQAYNGERYVFYLHSQDHPGDQDSHARGNALGVAYMLLTNGGTNPDCRFQNCSTPTPALGRDKASLIFFKTLTTYLTSNTTWSMLVDEAKYAAYRNYRNCPGSWGLAEQQAVVQAFLAIGYSSVGFYYDCSSP